MQHDVKIRLASAKEVIDLRWKLLRPGMPRETAVFEGDDELAARHIITEIDSQIVGCATFLHRPWEGQPAWQLRGMAVDANLQKSGVGRRMLEFAEQMLRRESYSNLMWCNARIVAKPFYERVGWQTIGDVFEIPSAGPHVKMTKRLNPR